MIQEGLLQTQIIFSDEFQTEGDGEYFSDTSNTIGGN